MLFGNIQTELALVASEDLLWYEGKAGEMDLCGNT